MPPQPRWHFCCISRMCRYPVFTIAEDLLFPDGNRLFKRIYCISACLKSCIAVGGRYSDDHRYFSHFQHTRAVVNKYSLYWPPIAGGHSYLFHFAQRHLFICFKFKTHHCLAPGAIAHGAYENIDAATAGRHEPRCAGGNIETQG